jgi:ribonuclease-3
VLSFIVSKRLMRDLPQADEGTLSALRSNLVSKKALFRVAKKLALRKFLLVGKGEQKGRLHEKTKIFGNAVEAVIAAVYLDRGFTAAEKFVMHFFGEFFSLRKLKGLHTNYKSQLQEWAQKQHQRLPLYKTWAVPEGFSAEVEVLEVSKASGLGGSKQEAEQMAAKHLVQFLKREKLLKRTSSNTF